MLEEPFTHEQYLDSFREFINSEENKENIEKIGADVVLFGHNHLQSYAYCGNTLVINPGSCGQPLDFDPSAAYTVLEITDDGLAVHERRAVYDVEGVIRRAMESDMYGKGYLWMDMVFMAIKNGRDYFGFLFEIAREITASKGESGHFFSNETWVEAHKMFKAIYV